MWNYKNYILSISLFFLIGCQFKPEVLFENINVGDNLEVCLANGSVQHNTDDENIFELRNNNIANTYFTNSEVKFDEKSTVKEIILKFHESKKGKTAKEVFNFMTQYFCLRYEGMRSEKIDENWEDERLERLAFKKEGIKNIWETNKTKIILESYRNTRIYIPHEDSNYSSTAQGTAEYMLNQIANSNIGEWVQLKIIAK